VLKDGVSGSYPTLTKSKAGDPVAVVQAGADSQFVGRLDLQFDAKGIVLHAAGDTIPVARYISPDPDVDTAVQRLAGPLSDLGKKPVQNAKNETITAIVALPNKPCLTDECPLGDLVADAIRKQAGAQIGIINAGGLGADLPLGTVTINTILAILPPDQTVSTFELRGADLTAALENGVSQAGTDSSRFPQVSGLRFKYDGSKPTGSRIVSVEIVSTGKGVSFTPIDPAAVYNVAATNFIRQGGDGYAVLTANAIDAYDFGSPISDVVIDYIAGNSPIPTKSEGRIMRQDKH
jgi:5'-nucleotidase